MTSTLNSTSFLNKNHVGIIHRAFISKHITSRPHLASTKTRGEVSGSGKKPWNQKGTGNARAGSKRSPIWRGGGVTFGPKPHNVIKKINKKEYTLALSFILKEKLLKNELFFIEDTKLSSFTRTKEIISFLNGFNLLPNKSILILQKNVLRTFNTLQKVNIKSYTNFSLEDLLKAKYVFLDKDTLSSFITII